MNLLILAITFLGFIWLVTSDWRVTIKFTLFVIVIEGAIRKWLFPQASDIFYFLKDIVLLLGYIKYYLSPEPKYIWKDSFLKQILFLAFLIGLFQVFNPNQGSIIIGLFGLKTYFFYIPLIWILPTLFRNETELYKFIRNYLLLVIPLGILATIQFFSPINSPINVYGGGLEATASAGDYVRVTATFPYLAGYTSFLTFCFTLIIPVFFYSQSKFWSIITVVELLMILGTSFMTGARGLIVYQVFFLVGYFFLNFVMRSDQSWRLTKKAFVPIFLSIAIIPRFFQEAINAFFIRANNSGSIVSRIVEPFTIKLDQFEAYGIGASHQAVSTLRNVINLPYSGQTLPPLESEMMKVVVEISIVGFFLWYGFRLGLIFTAWKAVSKLKNFFSSSLIISVFLFHVYHFAGLIVFNIYAQFYYWFLTGFIFLLPQLESKTNTQVSHEKQLEYNEYTV